MPSRALPSPGSLFSAPQASLLLARLICKIVAAATLCCRYMWASPPSSAGSRTPLGSPFSFQASPLGLPSPGLLHACVIANYSDVEQTLISRQWLQRHGHPGSEDQFRPSLQFAVEFELQKQVSCSFAGSHEHGEPWAQDPFGVLRGRCLGQSFL